MPKQQAPITWEERMQIFAKEVLTIDDICRLLNVQKAKASEIIKEIKTKQDRLRVAGLVHINDYIAYFGGDPQRYIVPDWMYRYFCKGGESKSVFGIPYDDEVRRREEAWLHC